MGLGDLADELTDRAKRKTIPHKINRIDYVAVRNDSAKDGFFVINGKRQVVYGRRTLSTRGQFLAIRKAFG